MREIEVNGRRYAPMSAPLVVVCVDGCEYDYLTEAARAGVTPWLAKLPCASPDVLHTINQVIWSPAGRRVAIVCDNRRQLTIIDPGRSLHTTRLRSYVGWTSFLLRWVSEDEIAFNGQQATGRGYSIFRVRLDTDGRFLEVPAIAIDAEMSLAYVPFSIVNGRMLVQRMLTSEAHIVAQSFQFTM